MSLSFFSPKGRLRTSKATAYLLNTLNMLSPILLLSALTLILISGCSNRTQPIRSTSARFAVLYFTLAIITRLLWGLAIRQIRRKKEAPPASSKPGGCD